MNLSKDEYSVLFLVAVPSLQFAMVPTILQNEQIIFRQVLVRQSNQRSTNDRQNKIIATSKDDNYSYIPKKFYNITKC
jgi:hypothetical protein